jgi:hypothetical protein
MGGRKSASQSYCIQKTAWCCHPSEFTIFLCIDEMVIANLQAFLTFVLALDSKTVSGLNCLQ